MSFKDRKLQNINGNTCLKYYQLLLNFSKMYKLPVTRLIGIAIDNEMDKETPFKINLILPPDSHVTNAYADQAGKILRFLGTVQGGLSLDMLYVLRHDMGIADREAFLYGLKECINTGVIESFIAPKDVTKNNNFGDVIYYRVAKHNPVVRKKIINKSKKDARDLATYERMKAKLEREGKK